MIKRRKAEVKITAIDRSIKKLTQTQHLKIKGSLRKRRIKLIQNEEVLIQILIQKKTETNLDTSAQKGKHGNTVLS